MSDVTRVGATEFVRPTDTRLIATRVIDAPRDLVWAAHTQCEHTRNWLLGLEGWQMPVCEIDLRPGGTYRYVFEGPDSPSFSLSGEYREIRDRERIVNSETMNDAPGGTVNTLELIEQDGHTVVRTTVDYPSKELREEIIATGMLDGWAESYDRLEEYLHNAH
jgi:uncharacterized protein YndB with AHSA1/START domain